MKWIVIALAGLTASIANGQTGEAARLNQHKVTNRSGPAPEPGAEVGPGEQDRKWFGDIRQAVIHETSDRGTYTRISLDLPIERDFSPAPPAPSAERNGSVSGGDLLDVHHARCTVPEQWPGKWLVEHGYVVLTSWPFIRHYREDSRYSTGAGGKLYERFGHWLPMAKMVHDAQREAEYLRSRKEVDGARIGFMGFPLSAKAAVYIAAFAPEIAATAAIDPHIAINDGNVYQSAEEEDRIAALLRDLLVCTCTTSGISFCGAGTNACYRLFRRR